MLYCLYDFYKIIWKYYIHGEAVTIVTGVKRHAGASRSSSTVSGAGLWQLFREHFLSPLAPTPSKEQVRFTRADLCLLLTICALYSFFALYDLGDRKAPETTYDMTQNQVIELEFPENTVPVTLASYIAPWLSGFYG